jgi:hypothetical protein
MNWNWFGWFGLLCFCLFMVFLAFPNVFPAATAAIPYKLASISLAVAMFSSVVCPIVASIHSSKWWLVLSACGLLSILWFFWHLAA